MRKKRLMIPALWLAGVMALPMAYAQNSGDDGPPPGMHGPERPQEIFKQLNLTDDQKKQLESNKEQHRAQMQNARQALKAAHDAMKAELMKPQLDMSQIQALHARIKSLNDQMEDEKLSSILAVRSILTPEQFSKFINLMHPRKPDRD